MKHLGIILSLVFSLLTATPLVSAVAAIGDK